MRRNIGASVLALDFGADTAPNPSAGLLRDFANRSAFSAFSDCFAPPITEDS